MISGGCAGMVSSGCVGGVVSSGTTTTDDKKDDATSDNKDTEKDKDKDKGKEKDKDLEASTKPQGEDGPVTLVVAVPTEARLTFNGTKAKSSTETERTFVSPKLLAGKVYAYDVEAKFTKDGESVVVKKRVRVQAGKTIRVDMTQSDDAVIVRK
jgi:uncharacterized protein (TIGR03000 family)